MSRRRVHYEAIEYEKERNDGFISPFWCHCWPAADAVCSMEVLWCFTISCSGIHGHEFIVVLEKQGKRSEKVQLIQNLEFQKCYKIPTCMKAVNPKKKKKKQKKPSKFNLKHKLEWFNETDHNNNYSHKSLDSIRLYKIIAHLKKREQSMQ